MASTIPAPLAGKIAVITGGSKGIGRATALDFARKGCTHIAITYKSDATGAQAVLEEIRSISGGIKTAAFPANAYSPDCGKQVVTAALESLQVDRIDIMVSNAAIHDFEFFRPVAETTKRDFDEVMTNLAWTPLQLAVESIPHMPSGGRIIMVSAAASKAAYPDPLTLLCAGKAALDAITRSMSLTYGAQKGITINSISVGCTNTPAMQQSIAERGPQYEAVLKAMSPLGRLGEPEEVASIISFVASPEASWINGNSIPANGSMVLSAQG